MKLMIFLGSGASHPLGYMTTAQMKEHMKKIGSSYISGDIIGSILVTPFDDVEYLYYSLYSIVSYLSDSINSSFFANLMSVS
jgi:hypothetical protein